MVALLLAAAPATGAPLALERLGTELVAAAPGGALPADPASASISDDGRFVAFVTTAAAVPSDTNNRPDVYLRDRLTARTTLVSATPSGAAGNGTSRRPAISGNGRIVAFDSDAPDLVPGDTNSRIDVFAFDVVTRVVERVSIGTAGGQGSGNSFNADVNDSGLLVVFETSAEDLNPNDDNGRQDIYLYNRNSDVLSRVSRSITGQPDGNSFEPAISGEGRHVAFGSTATNLTPSPTSGSQVFVRDVPASTNEVVSVDQGGDPGNAPAFAPSISDNGRYVAFYSAATDLVPDDGNGSRDVFRRDRTGATTTRLSVGGASAEATGGDSTVVALSDDGTVAAFVSAATNLTASDPNGTATDVYVRHVDADTTLRVSSTLAGGPASGPSVFPAVSSDGTIVAFGSSSPDMLAAPPPGGSPPSVYAVRMGTTVPPAFPDVPPGSAFLEPIQWMVSTAITSGYSDDTFRPTEPVTRQAVAAFLYRLTGQRPPAGACVSPFVDIPTDHPFCREISWAVRAGLAQGFPDSTFRPTNPISRQAMAAFLFRLAGSPTGPCTTDPFPDVAAGSPFCPAVTWMVGLGITGGYTDGTFRPGATITRQAAAAFLYRYDRLT